MTDDKVKARHDCEAANHGFDGSGCVFGYMQAKLDIAQAEMDKLSAEVERQRHENDRLHEVIAGIISTDAGNRADLEASEAKLAALVGHVQELVDFCDDPHGSEKAETLGLGLARLLPPIRQALAHHSAPVGEAAGDETAHLLSSPKNAARLAEATTPTSAPVEDVVGLVRRARDSLQHALAPFRPAHTKAEAAQVLADLNAWLAPFTKEMDHGEG